MQPGPSDLANQKFAENAARLEGFTAALMQQLAAPPSPKAVRRSEKREHRAKRGAPLDTADTHRDGSGAVGPSESAEGEGDGFEDGFEDIACTLFMEGT